MRPCSTFAGTVLAALSILVFVDSVAAQSDGETREARREFEAGRSAYEEGRFEDALVHFEAAYEFTESPAILYNIATVADRLRKDELALRSYERFLEERPETTDREHIEGRIRVLRDAVSAEPRETDPVPVVVAEEVEESEEPRDDDGGGGRVATWIALGGALAFGGATAGLWVAAQNEYDSLANTCAPACADTIVDASNGPLLQTLGNVFFGVSLAAMATAVVLFFVEGGGDGGESEVALGIAPGGVELRGRF